MNAFFNQNYLQKLHIAFMFVHFCCSSWGGSRLSRFPSKKYFITSTPGVILIDNFQSGGITLPWNEALWLDVPSQAWLVLTNQKALSQSKIVLNIIQYKTILAA